MATKFKSKRRTKGYRNVCDSEGNYLHQEWNTEDIVAVKCFSDNSFFLKPLFHVSSAQPTKSAISACFIPLKKYATGILSYIPNITKMLNVEYSIANVEYSIYICNIILKIAFKTILETDFKNKVKI